VEPRLGDRLQQLIDGSAGNPDEQQAGEFLASENPVPMERAIDYVR
jgi:hypothetical protein